MNVLLAATHSNSFTTSALPRRERVCSGWLQKNVHQSWLLALNPQGRERVAVGGGQKNVHHPCPLAP